MKYLIIGNGFDLSHNLPTKWIDFKRYLEKSSSKLDKELYGLIENSKLDYDFDFWSDVENAFNELYRDDNDLFKIIHSKFILRFQHYLYTNVELELLCNIDNYYNPKIHEYLKKFDVIISFNYTNTIEYLYGNSISKVHHIHGCLDVKRLEDVHIVIGYDGYRFKKLEDFTLEELYDDASVIDKSHIVCQKMWKNDPEFCESYIICHNILNMIDKSDYVESWGFSFSDCDKSARNSLLNNSKAIVSNVILGPQCDEKQRLEHAEVDLLLKAGQSIYECHRLYDRSTSFEESEEDVSDGIVNDMDKVD